MEIQERFLDWLDKFVGQFCVSVTSREIMVNQIKTYWLNWCGGGVSNFKSELNIVHKQVSSPNAEDELLWAVLITYREIMANQDLSLSWFCFECQVLLKIKNPAQTQRTNFLALKYIQHIVQKQELSLKTKNNFLALH